MDTYITKMFSVPWFRCAKRQPRSARSDSEWPQVLSQWRGCERGPGGERRSRPPGGGARPHWVWDDSGVCRTLPSRRSVPLPVRGDANANFDRAKKRSHHAVSDTVQHGQGWQKSPVHRFLSWTRHFRHFSSTCNQGVIFDSSLVFNSQISSISSTCRYHIRDLCRTLHFCYHHYFTCLLSPLLLQLSFTICSLKLSSKLSDMYCCSYTIPLTHYIHSVITPLARCWKVHAIQTYP